MAYSDTSIQINLINNVQGGQSKDDKIRIRKDLELNEFELTYTDQNDGTPVIHLVTGMYRARVMEYLYMLLKNQALDEEGYNSIQVTIPAMPRVIISAEKMKDLYYREHFLEMIGTGLDLLDNVESLTKVQSLRNTSRATHSFFD
jgi:hypothetical protein